MPYALGIDIRAGSTEAAVARLYRDRWEPPEVVLAIPSALALTADGPVVGVPGHGPDIVRGFVERIGDEVPLVVGGRPYRAANLAAQLIDQVVRRVEAAEGGPARQLAVAVPEPWGPYRTGLLSDALAQVGLDATLVPVAAGSDGAAGAVQRLVAPPDAVATYRPAPAPEESPEEPAYPPPRPPVVITALTSPRKRSTVRRPPARVVIAAVAVLVIALGVWLTLMSGFVRL
jgi:hypothetical protein